MKISAVSCFLLSFIFTVPSFSQIADKNIDLIISSEAMHVHFDKDIYLPGETIWFKAYLYNVNEPSYTATNFYVGIYDEKGNLLKQKQYPVLEGSCHGDLEIPPAIQDSRLRFRAFTRAMILEDSSNVYERVLAVHNKNAVVDSVATGRKINLQFFPEGDQVVAELQNYIVFKASYADGSPAMISGEIIDAERNKAESNFFTNKMGAGILKLEPYPGKKYAASWEDKDGNATQTLLPPVTRFGVSFHAEIINKDLQYSIAKNKSSDSLSTLHLLAQMGNYQVYKADLVIPNEMELSTAKFPIDALPAGMLQITLFDKYWNKLQQRLVFINDNAIEQQPVVTVDTVDTRAKGKNVIEISLPDTMFTNLSASIADINFYERPRNHSIRQDLWFNAQLKGLAQNLDSLFNSRNGEALDLITLGHNWKRYDWQKAKDKNSIKPELLDEYLSLSVKYEEKNFALPKDENLNLVIKGNGSENQFYNLKPTGQTSFRKTGLIFYDSVKVSYQMDKTKGLEDHITITKEEGLRIPSSISALPDKVVYKTVQPVAAYSSMEAFVDPKHLAFNDTQTIRSVTVRSRYRNPELARLDELDKFYTTGSFSGSRGFALNVIDDPMATANSNLLNYIVYRVPGLSVMDADIGKKRQIQFRNRKGEYVIKDTIYQPAIFIDEVHSESEDLQFLSMSQVAYVKYIPGVVIGSGFRSSDGAIYVYTKRGTEKGPPSKGLAFVRIKGYDSQKDYTMPDYSDKASLKEPDLRSTLYWNPNLVMDKTNNKVKVVFYNNDVSKKLLLTIEGVNEKGKLIHIEKIIE